MELLTGTKAGGFEVADLMLASQGFEDNFQWVSNMDQTVTIILGPFLPHST